MVYHANLHDFTRSLSLSLSSFLPPSHFFRTIICTLSASSLEFFFAHKSNSSLPRNLSVKGKKSDPLHLLQVTPWLYLCLIAITIAKRSHGVLSSLTMISHAEIRRGDDVSRRNITHLLAYVHGFLLHTYMKVESLFSPFLSLQSLRSIAEEVHPRKRFRTEEQDGSTLDDFVPSWRS